MHLYIFDIAMEHLMGTFPSDVSALANPYQICIDMSFLLVLITTIRKIRSVFVWCGFGSTPTYQDPRVRDPTRPEHKTPTSGGNSVIIWETHFPGGERHSLPEPSSPANLPRPRPRSHRPWWARPHARSMLTSCPLFWIALRLTRCSLELAVLHRSHQRERLRRPMGTARAHQGSSGRSPLLPWFLITPNLLAPENFSGVLLQFVGGAIS